ncbi:hypothetical protein Drose_35935 [Dactylosporangium roseum]|uniref:Uncharacterized protein n=1 Tax=Dactylosporangium roseum TaxID=47989 RepID=A0ABY5Z2V2_9ACTN|nr:hypothetical protein [Dactylosporangium roseum]UWZ36368.1 hypothetical protein Drose_35935 [Dactylosporangium roseum]
MSLGKRIASRNRDSLLALLTAAGASPSIRHRWPSVGHLLSLALRSSSGGRAVDVVDLPGLVEECLTDDPRISRYEDFVPADPRLVVLGRVGADVVRLFPGSVERPVADLARWALVAQATDSYLIEELGFGISHFTELALRYADYAVTVIAPAWPAAPADDDESVSLEPDELAAVQNLLGSPVPAGLLVSPQAQAAYDWATAPFGTLSYDVTDPNSAFGRYLAVSLTKPEVVPEQRFWLPPAFLPEATAHGVVELAARAAEEPRVARRFAQMAADRLRRALFRFADEVLGAPDGVDGPSVSTTDDVVQWVALIGDGRALAVQLVTQLKPGPPPYPGPPEAYRVAQAARRYPDRPVRVRVPGGVLDLGPGLEVVPLLVVASSGHVAPPSQPQGLPIMSLDDVIWASTTADEETDLYLFCRELARGTRGKLLAFEAINIWQWWHANGKTLFGGAHAPHMISIEPHWGMAEWERSAGHAGLEQALATLELSPIQDWMGATDPAVGPPSVYGWSSCSVQLQGEPEPHRDPADTTMPTPIGWQIHLGEVPVAVRCADDAWDPTHRETLNTLAGAFAYGIDQIAGPWNAAHHDVDVAGYLSTLHRAQSGKSPDQPPSSRSIEPANVHFHDGPKRRVVRAELHVDIDRLIEDTVADGNAAGLAMAAAFHDLIRQATVPEGAAETVRTAWEAAKPTYVVESTTSPTARPSLPAPWPLDDALVAGAQLAVAEAVRRAGVEPGTYTSDEAKRLDGQVLARAALAELTQLLSRHALGDLVATGMRQLDRTVAAKEREIADIRRARTMQLSWDPVTRSAEVEETHLRLRRCNETAIEAALRAEPAGPARVDQIGWMQILAAAWSYLEATGRSEAIHHQLNPTALTITTSYEIKTVPDTSGTAATAGAGQGRVYAVNVTKYRQARLLEQMGAPLSLDPEVDSATETDVHVSPSGDLVPEHLDKAMLGSYGASAGDILTVLVALARWPVPAVGDHLVIVERDDAVAYLLEATDLGEIAGGPDRASAAITVLTSTVPDLQAADWRPWHARSRKRRILIQPLVELPAGTLMIAPFFCYAAMTVYLNYLRQGLLPWSQPEPPKAINRALENIRDERNKALESDVDHLLAGAGYTTRSQVKETDPGRLGVPSLSGEIDTVAGHLGSRIIWLLEVKDPADIFVTPEIRRHLDTFYVGHRSKPAYLTQLQRKLADLAPYAAEVAAKLGLPPLPADTGYVVRPLFVTRRPVPAAFVGEETPFTTVGDLLRFIREQE